MNDYRIINADCLEVLDRAREGGEDFGQNCIFADPPDNLGLKYSSYKDRLAAGQYVDLLETWLRTFIYEVRTPTVWISFNARWILEIANIARGMLSDFSCLEFKPCVQTFTFGQHNTRDLGNGHRPLWRFKWLDVPIYPDHIRVPSWRQLHGDKRACSAGRVPSDVFDFDADDETFNFPRVTGNSKQRRKWCPTQLHENLIQRCILMSTKTGDLVLDPFAGTGTVLRVCKRIKRRCVSIEIDPYYCKEIAAEHGLEVEEEGNARTTI